VTDPGLIQRAIPRSEPSRIGSDLWNIAGEFSEQPYQVQDDTCQNRSAYLYDELVLNLTNHRWSITNMQSRIKRNDQRWPYSILLADDHRVVAEGLQGLLNPDFNVIEIVEDGQSLLAANLRLKPDVIITDISMPKMRRSLEFESSF
jgi:PleD family two-component response regulator